MTDLINTGYLFDLDGVVIDTESEYTRIWAEIDSIVPSGVSDFQFAIKGFTLETILEKFYDSTHKREMVKNLLLEKESAMTYRYLPGSREFLLNLKKLGAKMALVTSSNGVKLANLMSQLPEIKDFFDFIVSGDMVNKSKPDPEGYLLASRKIGINPSNCAVFEDSLSGVVAGSNAGSYVIGVIGTFTGDTIAPHSDLLVDNLMNINIPDLDETLRNRY